MSPAEVAERFEHLLVVTDTVLEHTELDELLERLADRVREALGVATTAILLREPGKGTRLRVRATSGFGGTDAPERIRDSDELAGRAADQRMAFIYNGNGAGSAMAAPLIMEGKTLGVLQAASGKEQSFAQVDLHFLQLMADRVAFAIHRARNEDKSAGKAKGNFLAIMSHELRTPLNSIIGYGELLEDEIVGPLNEVQREHLERIRESGWHLLELINQILSITQVKPDQEKIALQRIDAEQHAISAAAAVRPEAHKKGLTLNVDAPHEPIIIATDPDRLRHILLGMLSNAVKFTHAGDIILQVTSHDDEVRFSVSDTGIGIEEQHLGDVFEPFWQADQSNTRLAGGTGLGLQVARNEARLLGGDIVVSSDVGVGSIFTLLLPASQRPQTE